MTYEKKIHNYEINFLQKPGELKRFMSNNLFIYSIFLEKIKFEIYQNI